MADPLSSLVGEQPITDLAQSSPYPKIYSIAGKVGAKDTPMGMGDDQIAKALRTFRQGEFDERGEEGQQSGNAADALAMALGQEKANRLLNAFSEVVGEDLENRSLTKLDDIRKEFGDVVADVVKELRGKDFDEAMEQRSLEEKDPGPMKPEEKQSLRELLGKTRSGAEVLIQDDLDDIEKHMGKGAADLFMGALQKPNSANVDVIRKKYGPDAVKQLQGMLNLWQSRKSLPNPGY